MATPNLLAAAAHLRLGNAQRRSGATEQAIASYRAAIALAPGLALAHCNLGNAMAARGALAEAATAFAAALAAKPGFPAALLGLGHVRLLEQRYADALRCFAALGSTDAGIAYHTGVALQGLGDERAAARAFRAALRLAPGHLPALNNLCVALLRSGAPDAALVACEHHLARAPGSCKPLAYQAAALLALGRRDAARELLDFDRLLWQREIAVPHAAFHAELALAIQHHPSLRREPAGRSTRGGSQTGELVAGARGPAAALDPVIRGAVAAYIDHVRRVLPDHRYTAQLPRRWRLATWAVVLGAHGHQGPHFHPDGAISGVYYVSLPRAVDVGHAGWLELGRTSEALGDGGEPLLALVKPHAGRIVLFPSYFYHRTLPFEDSEPRISVAFDVVPV